MTSLTDTLTEYSNKPIPDVHILGHAVSLLYALPVGAFLLYAFMYAMCAPTHASRRSDGGLGIGVNGDGGAGWLGALLALGLIGALTLTLFDGAGHDIGRMAAHLGDFAG